MLRAMSESFVDLTYRGLALGRRVRLTQVRPTAGYLELPTPMPVGTTIAIVTDDGLALDAKVLAIHEQVGAAPVASGPVAAPTASPPVRIPGMLVAPVLAHDVAQTWWAARVSLPDLEPTPVTPTRGGGRGESTTVRPRAHTIPEPLREADADASGPVPVAVAEVATVPTRPNPPALLNDLAVAATVVSGEHSIPELVDDGKRTVAMDAIDPELITQLTRTTGEHAAVSVPMADDGRRTIAMDAVDLSALGLETSGPTPRATTESGDDSDDDTSGAVSADDQRLKTPGGSVKRRRKKR